MFSLRVIVGVLAVGMWVLVFGAIISWVGDCCGWWDHGWHK